MKAVLALAVVAALGVPAFAQSASPSVVRAPDDKLSLSYLWDGGMVPFFWVPLAARLGIEHYVEPRDTPLMFSPLEGGAPAAAWEVPGYTLAGLGIGTGLAIAIGGDESRWYHVKGLGESLMSAYFVAGVLKMSVGRHRPDWTSETSSPGDRQSFPSGHTTQAFGIATYAILYLRGHVFDKTRGSSLVTGTELLAYSGIALGAAALGAERVIHNRHHVTDVLAGAALGTLSSALFYWYQERRFQASRDFQIIPTITNESATIGLSFTF